MKDLLSLAVFVFLSCLSYAQRDTVIVRPVPINDVLINPNMGITTFNRFNGQATNPPLEWSEVGPVTKLPQAATKPDFPDTTIAYLRWYWNALEPEQGKIRWDIIDLALEEARTHGQTLAIRLMPYSKKDPLPEWYQKSGARRANKPTDKDGSIWEPDFSDPVYLKYWGELVAEAGRRYDGNPNLDSVDISSVGYWGEGWSPYMPAFPYQKALIDLWFDAFPPTTLLMNFDEQQALSWHVTSVNLKSSPIPDDWKPAFEDFQKKIGYRYLLRRLEYPKVLVAGSMMLIHMWWLNAGVAPPYINYQLAVQLRSIRDSAVINVPADVREWLPGDAVYDGSLYVPETLPEGTYDFRVAILDPRSGKPAIRFAIAGRDPDGWYTEGQIRL